jgi:hypothetical protein
MESPVQSIAPMQTFPSRDLFPQLLNELNLLGEGVEVGVQQGLFSEHILRFWKGALLYSIDPWMEFPAADYIDIANVPQAQQTELYMMTIRRLHPFGCRSKILRLKGDEAVMLFRDESLDFCYLDADHRYEAVRSDLIHWFPKIKSGGIIGGHDYIPDGLYEYGLFGVQRAVNEFITVHSLRLILTTETNALPSWFIPKP